jgi:hypothetical protein
MNIWDLKEDIIDTNKFCVILDDLKTGIDSGLLSNKNTVETIKGINIMLYIHINKIVSTFSDVIDANGTLIS